MPKVKAKSKNPAQLALRQRGLTQWRLAEQLGVGATSVFKAIHATRTTPLIREIRARLAEVLGMPLEQLWPAGPRQAELPLVAPLVAPPAVEPNTASSIPPLVVLWHRSILKEAVKDILRELQAEQCAGTKGDGEVA